MKTIEERIEALERYLATHPVPKDGDRDDPIVFDRFDPETGEAESTGLRIRN